jgi:hypothetical protein
MAPVIRTGSTSWTTHETAALSRKSSTANYPLECLASCRDWPLYAFVLVPDYPAHVRSSSCHTNLGPLGHDHNVASSSERLGHNVFPARGAPGQL